MGSTVYIAVFVCLSVAAWSAVRLHLQLQRRARLAVTLDRRLTSRQLAQLRADIPEDLYMELLQCRRELSPREYADIIRTERWQ